MFEVKKEIEYLLKNAEENVWSKAGDVMMDLYWEIGYVLKDYNEVQVRKVSKDLGVFLRLDPKMFELAYYFYKENPIKEKAVEYAS